MNLDNRRNDPEFLELKRIVRDKMGGGRKIVYAPNSGNWGDALIHFGTLQFLRSAKLQPTVMSRSETIRMLRELSPAERDDVVVVTPGAGNWCENWPATRAFVTSAGKLVREVIVLPTTFDLPAAETEKANVTYVARDSKGSLEMVPEAIFCHDMAFFLAYPEELLERLMPIGYFFRGDKERHPDARRESGQVGYDISAIGSAERDVRPFFKILSAYKKIVTDRMHVGIAGSLLGIETILYPGNYRKVPDVFASSIAGRYPATTLGAWE